MLVMHKLVHPVGEGLSEAIHIYCLKVVSTFMKVGVPLDKVDTFHELLDFRLCHSSNLCKLIPTFTKKSK